MITALAKLGSAALVGQFALAVAITLPVMTVTMLQLRAVQATDIAGEYAFVHYLGARLLMTTLGLGVIAGIAWYTVPETSTAWVVFLVGCGKSFESVSDVVRGLFQRYERMDVSAKSIMLKGWAGFVALAALFWATGSLLAAVAAMAISGAATLLLYDLPRAAQLLRHEPMDRFKRGLAPSFDPPVWRLIRKALPLGIAVGLLSLQSNLPRYVLEAWKGDEAVGYFSALAYVMAVGTLVINALGQAASPRLATCFFADMRDYRRLVAKLLLTSIVLGSLLVVGVVLFGRLGLRVFYRPEYAEFQTEFVLLAIGTAISFMASFCGYALTAAGVFRAQLVLGIVSCASAAAASFWLIPAHGIRGAVVTTIVTATAMLACFAAMLILVLRKGPREPNHLAEAEAALPCV